MSVVDRIPHDTQLAIFQREDSHFCFIMPEMVNALGINMQAQWDDLSMAELEVALPYTQFPRFLLKVDEQTGDCVAIPLFLEWNGQAICEGNVHDLNNDAIYDSFRPVPVSLLAGHCVPEGFKLALFLQGGAWYALMRQPLLDALDITAFDSAVLFSETQVDILFPVDAFPRFTILHVEGRRSISQRSRATVQPPAPSFSYLDVSFHNRDAAYVHGFLPELIDRFVKSTALNSPYFSPIVHLMNSSGYGKTKMALELAEGTTELFIPLGHGQNGSRRSRTGIEMFKRLASTSTGVAGQVYAWRSHLTILHLLDLCLEYENRQGGGRIKHFDLDKIVQGCIDASRQAFQENPLRASAQPANRYYSRALGQKSPTNPLIKVEIENFVAAIVAEASDIVNLQGFQDKGGQGLEKKVRKWLEQRQLDPRLPRLIIVLDEAHNLMDLPSYPGVRHPPFSSTLDSPIVVLLDVKNGACANTDMYRAFRVMTKNVAFYRQLTLTITISTIAKIEAFYPHVDPSDRPAEISSAIQHLEPITARDSFDCFVPFDGCMHSSLFEKLPDKYLGFLFSLLRVESKLSVGRPLMGVYLMESVFESVILPLLPSLPPKSKDLDEIGSQLLTHLRLRAQFGSDNLAGCARKDLVECVLRPFDLLEDNRINYFKGKISPLKRTNKNQLYLDSNDLNTVISLLGFAVGLQKYPSLLDYSELVRAHGMSCIDFNARAKEVEAMFMSEGALNAIAMAHLTDEKNLVHCLRTIHDQLLQRQFPPMMNAGEFGEILDKLMVLVAVRRALRKVVVKRYLKDLGLPEDYLTGLSESEEKALYKRTLSEVILEPVAFEDFMVAFMGEVNAAFFFKHHPKLVGSFLSLSHFDYMALELIEDPYSVATQFLYRGSAVSPKVRSVAIDGHLPLTLSDGRISFVTLQTKFGSSHRFGDNSVHNSSPERAFGSDLRNDVPHAMIIHHITNAFEEMTIDSSDSEPSHSEPEVGFEHGSNEEGQAASSGGRHNFISEGAQTAKLQVSESDVRENGCLAKVELLHRMSDHHPYCLLIKSNGVPCLTRREAKLMRKIIDWFLGEHAGYEKRMQKFRMFKHVWTDCARQNPISDLDRALRSSDIGLSHLAYECFLERIGHVPLGASAV